MLRFIDNHMLMYINDSEPGEYFVMGKTGTMHTNKPGEYTLHDFTGGKFKERELRFFIPTGSTVTQYSGQILFTSSPYKNIVITQT